MKSLRLEIFAPILFVTVFLIMLLITWLTPKIEEVNQTFLKNNIGKPGIIVVDVRSEEFYNGKSPGAGIPGGHIQGAINFPLADLKINAAAAALAKSGITKRAAIIPYCNTGVQSEIFAEALVRDFGFSASRIKHYKGSIKDWIKNPDNKLFPEDHETGKEGYLKNKGK